MKQGFAYLKALLTQAPRKLVSYLALSSFVVLTACASQKVIEEEVREDDTALQVHLEEIIHQVRLALVAIQAYYLEYGAKQDITLVLDEAKLSLNVSHVDTTEGGFALLVPAADTKENATASTLLKLTLAGPEQNTGSVESLKQLLSDGSNGEIQAVIDHTRAQSQQSCHKSPAPSTTEVKAEKELWQSITHIAAAGLDAYLCSLKRIEQLSLPLSEFEITLTIAVQNDETEGAIIQLGAWSLGSQATQESANTSTIVLSFKQLKTTK